MVIEALIKRARPEIVEMKSYSSARSLHKGREGLVFLDANECPFEPYIGAENLARYPDQQPVEVVNALCRLYGVSSRNLAVMRGADEAIDCLVRVFCAAGQDNVIITPPTFTMYAQSAAIQGVAVKEVLLKEGFGIDADSLKETADENTKIVFLCSPNNPTGTVIETTTTEEICAAFADRALVILDETYIEYTARESLIPLIDKYDNLIVLRTLSKAYAAAGLRCGVTIARPEIIELLLKVLPPYPLPQPVVQEVLRIFEVKNLKRLAEKRRELLNIKSAIIPELEMLDEVEAVFPSEVNFFFMRVKDVEVFCEKCLDGGIVIRNQSHQPGLENCVRISIGTQEEMNRLLSVLKGDVVESQAGQRITTVTRKTSETAIAVRINLDAPTPVKILTGIGFYDHMLEQIAKHGGFSLELECDGDLQIDPHHTVEDCAIALGEALKQALDDKRGIGRFGFTVPMDETLAHVALDLSGRFFLNFKGVFPAEKVGDLPTDMVEHVFRSLAENLQANLHIAVEGENTHHMVEACFKGFGRALRQAITKEGDVVPSTKGVL